MNDISGPMMGERGSYSWENKKYLLDFIMSQLEITTEDLESDPSWIKAKVRDAKITKVLEN